MLLDEFSRHFAIDGRAEPLEVLNAVIAAFSRLPYENLTKIIKSARHGRGEAARRCPEEVLADHRRWGTGGTCFSLTAALARLLRSAGWGAEPLLADRRYGANTHCALRVDIDGKLHILDPGFLVARPVPIGGEEEQRIALPTGKAVLRPASGGARIDLFTQRQDGEVYRLTYRTAPVDASEFYRAWDDSFDWEMMRYPVLTQTIGGRQRYLRGRYFQDRGQSETERRYLAYADVALTAAGAFGIHPGIVRSALEFLRTKGGAGGVSPGC
jgi:arylamine N-acetyltransferase